MVARKATDAEIVTAVREGGTYYAAARLLDMAESSVRERARKLLAGRDDGAALAEKGLLGTEPVLPGYVLKRSTAVYDREGDLARQYVTQAKAPGRVAEIPAGHVVKGYSILKDAEGRVTQEWMKTYIPQPAASSGGAGAGGGSGRYRPRDPDRALLWRCSGSGRPSRYTRPDSVMAQPSPRCTTTLVVTKVLPRTG